MKTVMRLLTTTLLCTGATLAHAQTQTPPQTDQATHDLQLAQRLTPGSLASNSAQQQMLDALYTMLGDHPDVLRARAALESAGHDVETAKGARWPTVKIGTSSGSSRVVPCRLNRPWTMKWSGPSASTRLETKRACGQR